MADLGKRDQERLDSLRDIRETGRKMGNTPEGKAFRSVTMMFACMIVVSVVLLLFNLVTGRGVCDIMAIPLAAFTGLAWSQYRETQEREMGWYAVVAGALTLVMAGMHMAGLL